MRAFVGTYDGKILSFDAESVGPADQNSSDGEGDADNSQEEYVFLPVFKTEAHVGCVKTLACCDMWLASGGTDETIRRVNSINIVIMQVIFEGHISPPDLLGLYFLPVRVFGFADLLFIWDLGYRVFDLRKMRDHGTLHQHTSSLKSLQFHGNTHLLSGSEDGTIIVWRTSDWAALHTLHHKSGL
jgi:WD40 repeat protein